MFEVVFLFEGYFKILSASFETKYSEQCDLYARCGPHLWLRPSTSLMNHKGVTGQQERSKGNVLWHENSQVFIGNEKLNLALLHHRGSTYVLYVQPQKGALRLPCTAQGFWCVPGISRQSRAHYPCSGSGADQALHSTLLPLLNGAVGQLLQPSHGLHKVSCWGVPHLALSSNSLMWGGDCSPHQPSLPAVGTVSPAVRLLSRLLVCSSRGILKTWAMEEGVKTILIYSVTDSKV